ncbi:MAG: copper resistance protein CopC [Methylocystis sp.]|nr:MAG: copper resistance protein CopC [Methylocystis sp.]
MHILSGVLTMMMALSLAPAAPARAHATLVTSYPSEKQKVYAPLHRIRLVFSGKADALYSVVRLETAKGAVVAEVTQRLASREIVLKTPALDPGRYQIVYRVLSTDGDIVEGKVGFEIFGVEV